MVILIILKNIKMLNLYFETIKNTSQKIDSCLNEIERSKKEFQLAKTASKIKLEVSFETLKKHFLQTKLEEKQKLKNILLNNAVNKRLDDISINKAMTLFRNTTFVNKNNLS